MAGRLATCMISTAMLGGAMAPLAGLCDEITVADGIMSPEGPVLIGEDLYFVGAIDNKVYELSQGKLSVINAEPGCGQNGLAVSSAGTLLVACSSLEHPAILEIDRDGKELNRWQGAAFEGGVNDIVVASDGGVYATICGPFVDPPQALEGRVIYRAPGGGEWVTVAADLNYANGIGLSPDQKTLYVGETIGNAIKKFDVGADGSLSGRSNFALLNVLVPNKGETWWYGPDGMKIDAQGNMYVAQWEGGRVLKIGPDGKLLDVIEIVAGRGTMNVALGDGGTSIYVAVAYDLADPELKGAIVKVPLSE